VEGEVSEVSGKSQSFEVETPGRGTLDITDQVQAVVRASAARSGLCNVFVHHTSASIILCENADASVRRDLERFTARWVPDGDPLFEHDDEGADDMPAHIRSIFSSASIGIPIENGRLDLGTWQGIYLWEHRTRSHRRRITVSVINL
jgi:secondary thiamine-phosphate synthase enzyme